MGYFNLAISFTKLFNAPFQYDCHKIKINNKIRLDTRGPRITVHFRRDLIYIFTIHLLAT